MDEATVVCCGYLKKSPPERRLMRTWHKRFFVLKSDKTLTYYPSEKDKRPVKGPIDLNLCQSIEANLHHNNKNFKHVFSIITTMRTYYLVADSHEEMDKWVKHLCKCCGFEKQDGKSSPDFLRNRAETKSQDIIRPVEPSTLPSPVTPSPPPICPLSPPKSPTMAILSGKPERSLSDPPDSDDVIRRAEKQYIESRLRRKSSEIIRIPPAGPNMTLPLKAPQLSQLPECYDIVPPPVHSESPHEVDGGYDSLKPPPCGVRVEESNRLQPLRHYDVVPRPRPLSSEVCDGSPKASDDDIYDIPPTRNSERGNYDVVPTPRPVSQNDPYDYVPRHNRYSYNPEDTYDTLPIRHSREMSNLDIENQDVYDIVPPPRPQKSDSDYYDTLPPPNRNSEDVSDTLPNMAVPARPPKPSNFKLEKDHYDIVPAPGSKKSVQGLELGNRDSGSYSDDIYDVPPKQSNENDIYDIPPRPSDGDIYDELPRRSSEDCYDIPPTQLSGSDSAVPPVIDRSIKPPPLCRSTKPSSHDYTNLAPPVDRKSKPVPLKRSDVNVHSYENLSENSRMQLIKSHSLPETDTRDYHQTDYCDMQPYRSDDTRCYSFSKENYISSDCYEEMGPSVMNRESGVHSNSSSSEDGDTEDCYMTMEAPENTSHPQRKAALQYCEVQIVDGQTKSQVPVRRRDAESHYTTINEESTQAFLQTCRQQKTSRN